MTTTALTALQSCRRNLLAAWLDIAALNHPDHPLLPPGARAARGRELSDTISAAINHVERLATVVEGEQRADQQATR